MASPSAILSVLVTADTGKATTELSKYDRQLQAVNDTARKGIETQLGANVDDAGFRAYEARLARTARIAKDREAFKAQLGANFNNAGFLAYERAVDKAKREAAVGVEMQVKITDAMKRLSELQVRLGQVPDKISTKVEVDTGVATAKLDLLNRKIRETERNIAGGSGGGGGGLFASLFGVGGGGSGPGTLLSGVPGGGGGAGLGLVGAGLPAIAGGVGAATAVAGSAGAAALGAGALGTGALGVGAAGLGPILALSGGMKDAIALSTKLDAAQSKLAASQQLYGDKSKQAASAQKSLNLIVAEADPAVLKFAQSWNKFDETLSKAEQSVLPAISKALAPVLDTVTQLLPTIVDMAKIDLSGISKGLQPLLALFHTSEFKNSLLALSDVFARLAKPIGDAATSLLTAFLRVAVVSAPYLVDIANAFAKWAQGLQEATRPGGQLSAIIAGLVGQLKSWWELAKSVGQVMVTIFSAGAGTGQGLVNLLAGIVRHFNAWLNTKSGQEALKKFFADSARLVEALVSAFAPLIGAVVKLAINLMPAFTDALHAMKPALDLVAGLISKVADALGGNGGLARALAIVAIYFLPGGQLIIGLIAVGEIIKNMPAILHALGTAWHAVWDAMKIAFNVSLSFILGGISSLLGAIKFLVDSANIKIPGVGHLFGDLGNSVSKHLGQAQDSIDAYRRTLDGAAAKSKTDLNNIGDYHESVATRVQLATAAMISHVQTGIVTVDSKLGQEMKKLGTTVQDVLIGASQHPLQSKPAFGHAGGGLIQIGKPGEKGRDAIPLSIGGANIVVGAGEQAAIFNNEQQAVLNSRLADIGGLAGLFSKHNTPHYMASGGMVGNIGAMIAEANRVDAQHFPYVWGGGHSGFTGGPFDCSGAVSDILHAGGVLNAPRVSGDFMNYGLPGPGPVTLYANPTHVYMSIDGKYFGTSGSNPGGGAGWFPGGPRPGFTVRHAPGGSADSIKTPAWTGPGGVIGGIGKRAVQLAAKGANGLLSKAITSAFSGGFGGGQHPEGALANQALGKQMMLAEGWGQGQWPFLQKLWSKESGWDANARNAQSGAAGIPQDITGNFHGGARGQIAWGLNYIKDRYGSPAAAWAHEVADNWYAKGGMVGKAFAGGGLVRKAFAGGGTVESGGPWSPVVQSGGPWAPVIQSGGPWTRQKPEKPQPLDQLAGYGTRLGNLESDLTGRLSQYGSLSGRFSTIEQGAQFFNPDGSTNAAGIAQQVADDNTLLALAQSILGDYQAELPLVSTALSQFLGAKSGTGRTITADLSKITKNKLKIAANKRREAGIRTALFDLGRPSADQVGALERQIAAAKLKYDPAIKRAETAKSSYHGKNKDIKARLEHALLTARGTEFAAMHPLEMALNAARGARSDRRFRVAHQKFDLREQLRGLVGEDVKLATADTGLRSAITGLKGILSGAGGAQGENAIISSLETVAGKLGTVLWGKDGKFLGIDTTNQGAAFDEQTTIDQLTNSLAALNAPAAPAAAAAATDPSVALLQQLLQNANLTKAVSEAQFKVLGNVLPFGGSFAQGGVVPGPIGAPVGIIAHGGETVSPGAANVRVIMEDHRTRVFVNDVEQAIEQVGRRQSRQAQRMLPGSTGR